MKLLENVWLHLAECRQSELLEQKQVPWFPLVSSSPLPCQLSSNSAGGGAALQLRLALPPPPLGTGG